MASKSKEDNIRKLILENSPLRHWHFKTIVEEAKVTHAVANKWLKRYVKEGLLQYVKAPERFPYYTAGTNNSEYNASKRLYALEQLYHSGLIQHLLSLSAETIIIFGSMARADWYKESDIDLFIYGDASAFNKQYYEQKLHRTIDVHHFENKEELSAVQTGLLKNVVNGYLIKGDLQTLAA